MVWYKSGWFQFQKFFWPEGKPTRTKWIFSFSVFFFIESSVLLPHPQRLWPAWWKWNKTRKPGSATSLAVSESDRPTPSYLQVAAHFCLFSVMDCWSPAFDNYLQRCFLRRTLRQPQTEWPLLLQCDRVCQRNWRLHRWHGQAPVEERRYRESFHCWGNWRFVEKNYQFHQINLQMFGAGVPGQNTLHGHNIEIAPVSRHKSLLLITFMKIKSCINFQQFE